MNKKLLYGLMAAFVSVAGFKAQRHEIGLRAGMSNLVGDIGQTSFLLQKPMDFSKMSDYGFPGVIGGLYRMNFNPHQTLRFDVSYAHVQFNDNFAKEEYRRNRKMWGTNNILSASAIFEYNFLPVNNEQKSMLSPYIFGGIGGMVFDVTQATLNHDFRRDTDGAALAPQNEIDFVSTASYSTGKRVTMHIPFGIGLKYKFNNNWALFGEMMFSPTISDQLDYSKLISKDIKSSYNGDIVDPTTGRSLLLSSPYFNVSKEREEYFINERTVGDTRSKDWVNSVTLGLSYSFGRPPCYCD
jgi:opacity protein-like surface antigen